MFRIVLMLIGISFLSSCQPEATITFNNDQLKISLDSKGYLTGLENLQTGEQLLANDTIAPLLCIRIDSQLINPTGLIESTNGEQLTLSFPGDITVSIEVSLKESHIKFEITDAKGNEEIELAVWGPYPTIISKSIGETVGVVRGEKTAFGLQALNPKTLGGFPWQDNDCMPQLDIFESGDYSDLSEKGKRYVLYRVEAAKPTDFGSTLQAYVRNRTEERVTKNWGHQYYTIPAYEDGGIIGSKIALFSCPVDSTMNYLEAIELSEDLPHPIIDGQWGKKAPSAAAAYMIMNFGEADIEKALKYTQQAGLRYLYHSGPFANWGRFDLQSQSFPNGWDGLKNCVQVAKEQDIYVGVHTLSNFITTDDPYVSPTPDPRLAKVGSATIPSAIDPTQKEIPISTPHFFNQFDNNHLRTVQIGDELIRYGSVSETEPWILKDCIRGAFETQANAHEAESDIHKLADHGYKVFLTNPELSQEMSKRLAELFNYCDLRQISFDGLEGNRSTGMGNYGEILFTKNWFDNLDSSIKQHFIADASRTSHFFWHIYSRMNWGEPWYADFRESQTEYRLKNQAYFQRNLMPAMLGWFSLRPNTSIEDIEWMLARSAAFNAGYGFVCGYEVLEQNANTPEILQLIKTWEEARMSDVFTEDQKQRMQDISKEFSLVLDGEALSGLREIYSFKFQHAPKVRQPGEPTTSDFTFENPVSARGLTFTITAVASDLANLTIEIDNYQGLSIPFLIPKDHYLKYSEDHQLQLFDPNWNLIRNEAAPVQLDPVKEGKHQINLGCDFQNTGEEAKVKLEIRIQGDEEVLEMS